MLPLMHEPHPLSTIVETPISALAFGSPGPPLSPSVEPLYQSTQDLELFVLDIAGETSWFPFNSSIGAESDGDYDLATGTTWAGEQGHTADVVEQSEGVKRKASMEKNRSLKRTRAHQESLVRMSCYMQMEEEKCARLGISYNQQNYLHTSIVDWISVLDREKERDAVSMISIGIGSSESIAHLQHIVVESRGEGWQTNPSENLAPADRIREIQQLDGQIAYIEILRRCHIWKLYTDLSHDNRSLSCEFDIATPESITLPSMRRAGNPSHFRDSEITKAMFRGLGPEVSDDNRAYQKQYRYYTRVRRLGERLQLLTKTFGFGVLGLIPSQDASDSGDCIPKISDDT
jgi:hypothetical protein